MQDEIGGEQCISLADSPLSSSRCSVSSLTEEHRAQDPAVPINQLAAHAFPSLFMILVRGWRMHS